MSIWGCGNVRNKKDGKRAILEWGTNTRITGGQVSGWLAEGKELESKILSRLVVEDKAFSHLLTNDERTQVIHYL